MEGKFFSLLLAGSVKEPKFAAGLPEHQKAVCWDESNEDSFVSAEDFTVSPAPCCQMRDVERRRRLFPLRDLSSPSSPLEQTQLEATLTGKMGYLLHVQDNPLPISSVPRAQKPQERYRSLLWGYEERDFAGKPGTRVGGSAFSAAVCSRLLMWFSVVVLETEMLCWDGCWQASDFLRDSFIHLDQKKKKKKRALLQIAVF